MPHDIFIGDVYFPPLLVSATVALILVAIINSLLRSRGLMAHFTNTPLVFISLVVVFTVILGSTLFRT